MMTSRKEREKAAMLTGRSFNSTSKIDSFARILFPLTFTLFNVIYWMHYFKVGLLSVQTVLRPNVPPLQAAKMFTMFIES